MHILPSRIHPMTSCCQCSCLPSSHFHLRVTTSGPSVGLAPASGGLLLGPPPKDHLAHDFDVTVFFSPLPFHIHTSSYTHSSNTILKHASLIVSTAVPSSIHSFIMHFTTLIAAMTFVAFGFTAPADPQEKAHGLEARQWQCSFPYYDQLCDECYHEHGCEFGCDWYVSFRCQEDLHTDDFHSPDCMKLSVRLSLL